MSRQDKATTERFTRTLRELVKRPENKVCADCKRNDPRWASWNIGIFLCIRCSGIHRGMGTHISKVKSVDLDVWTPEQMESIQSWGNYRANLYWEAHLKPGHIPPEHKMESFIRSKYESRRWALDGPPPLDPSVLDNGSPVLTNVAQPAQPSPVPPIQQQAPNPPTRSAPTRVTTSSQPVTRQPQAHQLLSSNYTTKQSHDMSIVPAPLLAEVPAPQASAPENELFSLDFRAPAANITPNHPVQAKKDVKQDILSLFSTPSALPAPQSAAFGQFGASPWGGPQQPQQPISMIGSNGTGTWGSSSGWTGTATILPAQANVWGPPPAVQQQHQQPISFNSNDAWGGPASTAAADTNLFNSPFVATSPAQKTDDVFGDLWGGFK